VVHHASSAIPVQQDPRPGLDGPLKISREAVEEILLQGAGRDEDPPGPDDLPLRALRGAERRHARIGAVIRPDRGIQATQSIRRLPQLDLGPQSQVGLGPLVTHASRVHRAGRAPG
jgi:hypothetical protein